MSSVWVNLNNNLNAPNRFIQVFFIPLPQLRCKKYAEGFCLYIITSGFPFNFTAHNSDVAFNPHVVNT